MGWARNAGGGVGRGVGVAWTWCPLSWFGGIVGRGGRNDKENVRFGEVGAARSSVAYGMGTGGTPVMRGRERERERTGWKPVIRVAGWWSGDSTLECRATGVTWRCGGVGRRRGPVLVR